MSYYDPTLATEAPERKRRMLTFIEPGTFVKKYDKMRAKERGEVVVEDDVPKKKEVY